MYVNYDTPMLTERKHDVERDMNEQEMLLICSD